jgi:hypothetical protein
MRHSGFTLTWKEGRTCKARAGKYPCRGASTYRHGIRNKVAILKGGATGERRVDEREGGGGGYDLHIQA